MILVDANLLVYSYVTGFTEHEAARNWLDGRLAGTERVGLPWESLTGFVRLTTNPRVFERPAPVAQAWRQVEEWLDCEPAWIPLPTVRHRQVLGSLLTAAGPGGNLVPDAHVAALAVQHGLAVASTDGDFARFPGVRWQNPLAPAQS